MAPIQRLSFRLLGEFEVSADGAPIALGGTKQRTLLAVLLLERTLVSTDRLIEAVWSGSPPATAQKSIQIYVSGLRKALGEERIATRRGGYELMIDDGEVDIDVFDRLVREASAETPDVAAERLREALGLVRGPPFADIALESWLAPAIARIEERVLVATERRIEAELQAGRHRELVPELEGLVSAHPFRERPLEFLMLALYRAGRQAEALDAYRRGADRMRDELGLEPRPPLQQLQASILQHDEHLAAPPLVRRDAVVARRRQSWRLAVAGALALVAAAAAAVAIAMTRGDSASLESVPPGVAIISATDGALVTHIPASEIAEPVQAVTDRKRFWVWSLQPFSLVGIDPADGKVLRRVASPFAGDASWYLPDDGGVWFSGAELVRVDVSEGRAVARYPLAGRNADEFGLGWVARCAGSLWVADNGHGRVLRVRPSTGEVSARIAVQSPWAVACGDGGLWITSDGLGAQRIDPRTNAIVATARVPYPNLTLAVGGGYAWTSNEANGTVYKIDPSGAIVATYQTGDGARELSFADGRVWVVNQDVGTVTGIDAATADERTFSFGHPLQTVAATGSRLLVVINPGLTYEDRIDALEGRVARLIVPVYAFASPDAAIGWNPWNFLVERATCSGLVAQAPGDGGVPGGLVADLAAGMPAQSDNGRTYTFRVRRGARFAPPANTVVTTEDVRASIERALSPKLGADIPGIRFLGDVLGAQAFHRGETRHVRGIRVTGDAISITLTRPAKTFLQRLALPFFCTVPANTPRVNGGLQTLPAPSAGPYMVSEHFNGEYLILKRNPNYTGPRRATLDAIAFREGISPEHAVARVRSGTWDGAVLVDDLLAPGGAVARQARAGGPFRTEELPVRGVAYPGETGALHALLSSRLGCDEIDGVLDLTTLCIRDG